MSWRDDTPQTVQSDLDEVLERIFQVVEQVLVDLPGILPFGVQTGRDGNAALVIPDPQENDAQPVVSTVMDEVLAILASRAQSLRVIGTAMPVEVDGVDAVCVEWEHRDGGPGLRLLRQYTPTRKGMAVQWGESQAQVVDKRLWG